MDLSEGDRIKVFENTDVHSLIHYIRTQGFRAELHGEYILIIGRYKYQKELKGVQFGNWLKNARREKGLTREKFAEACGVSVRTVWDWEIGIRYPKDIWIVQRVLDL